MILDRPPTNWQRPTMTLKVKCQVLINQEGRSAVSKERLGRIEDVQFDHRPPLNDRQFDTEANDTIPPANDPAFIEAITTAEHKVRTFGPGGEKRISAKGGDLNRFASARRIQTEQDRHRAVMDSKTGFCEPPPRKVSSLKSNPKIPSRPFQKRQRTKA